MAGTHIYKWTDEETIGLIRLRSEKDHYFTGKRHTAKNAWEDILEHMGLQGHVSPAQVGKKWDNLKQKYKELLQSATETGTERGETTAANWPFFTAMHEAIGGGEAIDLSAIENLADVTSEASGSSLPGSAMVIYKLACGKAEEQGTQHISHYTWTEEETVSLIRLRCQNHHLFTGKRHAVKKAWDEIIQQMGLQGKLSSAQIAKKWDNMKQKYKELIRSATETGTERGETTAANWPFFTAMHEAIGGGEAMDLSAIENLADVTSEASGSSLPGSAMVIYKLACGKAEEQGTQHISHYTWTEGETITLIRLRSEHHHLFTGKRHTAKKAWEDILEQMGLQGLVSHTQAAKKWDNLKQKYKELIRAATETGTERGETTAANWPFFTAMHEAIGGGEAIDLSAIENLADVTSEASGSSLPGSVGTIYKLACGKAEEQGTHPVSTYTWSHVEILSLILLRSQNDHLFTGKKHTAKRAWDVILQQMGLQGQVSAAQVSKKWNNLKQKYKELQLSATGTGTDQGETAAASWPFFNAMHSAIGQGEATDPPMLMDSCPAENPGHVADEASDASGSSPASYSVVCVEVDGDGEEGEQEEEEEEEDDGGEQEEEEEEEEVDGGELEEEEEEEDGREHKEEDDHDAQRGSLSPTQEDSEPCSSGCSPPPKRSRSSQAAILEFLKEEAVREEERFRAALEHTNRFLDLFERLVNKL